MSIIVTLLKQRLVLLFPAFLLFIIIVGIQLRKVKLPLFLGINILTTIISLLLGYFFSADDGSWFKPFGRDVAIIFISVVYILGQLIVRWISKAVSTDWKNQDVELRGCVSSIIEGSSLVKNKSLFDIGRDYGTICSCFFTKRIRIIL